MMKSYLTVYGDRITMTVSKSTLKVVNILFVASPQRKQIHVISMITNNALTISDGVGVAKDIHLCFREIKHYMLLPLISLCSSNIVQVAPKPFHLKISIVLCCEKKRLF